MLSDIFTPDAFGTLELTLRVNELERFPYRPSYFTGVFEEDAIATWGHDDAGVWCGGSRCLFRRKAPFGQTDLEIKFAARACRCEHRLDQRFVLRVAASKPADVKEERP